MACAGCGHKYPGSSAVKVQKPPVTYGRFRPRGIIPKPVAPASPTSTEPVKTG